MTEILSILAEYFEASRYFIGGALCLFGAILAIIGTIGVLRFPDFYTRLHAASVTDTASVSAMVIGMAFLSEHWLVLVKLAVIWLFILMTGPTSSHSIANAAHTAGLEPLIGPQNKSDGEAG